VACAVSERRPIIPSLNRAPRQSSARRGRRDRARARMPTSASAIPRVLAGEDASAMAGAGARAGEYANVVGERGRDARVRTG
jgi:hypothetical protein